VTLVAANVDLPAPPGVRRIDVGSAAELERSTTAEFEGAHVLLMAAAPADFRPRTTAPEKLSRGGSGLELALEPTEDILAKIGAARGDGQTVVGFAAEHGEGRVGRAREKLARKRADMIVLNDVSDPRIGFESEQNAVTLVTAGGDRELPLAPKGEIAEGILDAVEALRSAAVHR
jgi:phosphopantothenoylcysteine decarboxylase/phosphopantothenate--cysteine ligase